MLMSKHYFNGDRLMVKMAPEKQGSGAGHPPEKPAQTLGASEGGNLFLCPQAADYSAVIPDERRQRLLKAAMSVIAENALENVTMERIAKEAGVTRITLYREFGNRGALIEAVIAYRLALFDEQFFASIELPPDFSELVRSYLLASVDVTKNNPVARRWASGGMRFLYTGSLVHSVATATWTPVLAFYSSRNGRVARTGSSEIALWLVVLQYSLGRMVVETGCDKNEVSALVLQFVSPAFV